MMIRIGDSDYLDLSDQPEIERRVKLFEDVSTIDGDFSYSFGIPKTQKNVAIIKIYQISTTDKRWSKKIPATIEDDSGVEIYYGSLRIESGNKRNFNASFFSGNSNWIDTLNKPLKDLDWSKYQTGLYNYSSNSGMVFPIVDNGLLFDRKPPSLDRYELMPYIYVKNIIQDALNFNGIKLKGDVLTDDIYNNLIVSSGNVETPQQEIDNRAVFVGKTTQQLAPTELEGFFTTIIFDDGTGDYYNSVNNNWDFTTNRYVLDVSARIISFKMLIYVSNTAPPFNIRILKNNTTVVWSDSFFVRDFKRYEITNKDFILSQRYRPVFIGDYFEIQIQVDSGAGWYVLPNTEVKIELDRFIDVFPETVVPDLTLSAFLSDIFKLLNKIVIFDSKNQVMTVSSFDRVLSSDALDLSEYITINDENYTEFVSDYSKENLLVWQNQSIDEVTSFNESNKYPYGSGVINIDNDFLDESDDFISMDYVAPWHRVYSCVNLSMPYTGMVTSNVVETRDVTSISEDMSGYVLFNFNGGTINWTGLFRIKNAGVESYNGTYFGITGGTSIGAFYPYAGNSTAQIEFIEADSQKSDPVLLLNNPGLNIEYISGIEFFTAGNLAQRTEIAVANFIQTDIFKGSLSFNDLKNSRFINTERALNNGTKSYGTGYLPIAVYRKITFLSRVRINEDVYYVNNITGYKGSQYPCEIELIKLN